MNHSNEMLLPERIRELGEQLDYLNSAAHDLKNSAYWALHSELSEEYAILSALQSVQIEYKEERLH